MLLTTTAVAEGRPVDRYLGIVAADVVMGTNLVSDFFASVRDVVGGRAGSYEKILTQAKEEALADLAAKAQAMGADGVLGIDLDYEIIGGDRKTMLVVSASGTAVKFR